LDFELTKGLVLNNFFFSETSYIGKSYLCQHVNVVSPLLV